MGDNERGTYDREWRTESGMPPCSRLRIGLTKEGGTPIRFVIQIEHRHEGTWLEVVRSDHDREGPFYRNVELAGLHVDVYHPELGQFTKRKISGPLPADEGMGRAARYLRVNAERYVERFEEWL